MSSSPLALVLLDNPATPDMVALSKALAARHPDLAVEAVADSSGSAAGSPLIRCGGKFVAVMSMPARIPDDAGLWSRAEMSWPEGKSVAARHCGHLIVSMVGEGESPLSAARLITSVVGALIATVPGCSAVVWNTKVAKPAALWQDMARASFAPFPDYPFMLWIDILPFRSDTGIGAFTMGLSVLAGREIEFETDRLDLPTLIDKVAQLGVYLIEHGARVKDGDTFGESEQERFIVRHRTSERFAGLPVFFCADE